MQNVPAIYAKKYVTNKINDAVLQILTGEIWQVKIIEKRNEMKITRGWKTFVKDNKLQVGDVCVLQLMKDTKKLIFKVYIIVK